MTAARLEYPYAFLILDAHASGTPRDQTMPGGAPRYCGTRFAFADTPEHLSKVTRALGIGDDAAVLNDHRLACVQVPTAPLRRARIDPVFQIINDHRVFDGRNATRPLETLRDACLAVRSETSRAFLIDLSRFLADD
jgi:hypothetical protein